MPDSQIEKIFELIMELAAGNLGARGRSLGTGDELDGIIAGLNMLAEELSDRVISLSEAEQRAKEILEIITAIASLDFSRKAPVGKKGDIFDSICAGLNSLAKELHASTVSRDYFDSIIRSMKDMLLVLNPDGTIRTVNAATQQILGRGAEELAGGGAEMIFGEKINPLQLITSDTERTFLAKDGRKIPVSFSCSLLHDESKRIQGMVCVAQDITERKETLEALRIAHLNIKKKAGDLEVVNEELQQYAYAVSHDIMAPLRAIHNYADFLREDLEQNLGQEQESYLEGIKHAAQQGKELAERLLELSRIGTRKNDVESIHPGEFFGQLTVSLDLPPDVRVATAAAEEWPVIRAEKPLLRQVFQNLVTNAVKFNRSPHKRVEIGWVPLDEDCCELFVRDNGIGIEPRFHDQIFGLFQQLHTHEEFEGSGIGLAIVKKAAAKMNGSVRLESTPGQGTTFFVKLPTKQKE